MSEDEALDVWAENMKLEEEILRLRAENIDLLCALKKIALIKNTDSYLHIDDAIEIAEKAIAAAAALKEMGND